MSFEVDFGIFLLITFLLTVSLWLLRKPLRRWWPFQAKRLWTFTADIPEAYVKLAELTNVWDPYKRKAVFLFLLGMGTIGMLDTPGLFFTNPYTHIVEGPAAYLGILGAITVGLLGLMSLWAYQYYKDYSVMQFTFGAFNLRVRKNFRVAFHAMLGTIERVPDLLAEELKAILDNKIDELRQANKILPLEQPTAIVPAPPPAGTVTLEPTKKQAETRAPDLHLFYIPMPGLLEKCGIPGVFHLSRAEWPEQLICPLPGEWIWEGWIRHAKGEVFDLATCGEWQYRLKGQTEITVIPITASAGTYYDFTWALERALRPPIIDAGVIATAKNNGSARVVGLEAVQQLQVYKDHVLTNEAIKPEYRELVMETVGGILEYLEQTNKANKQQPTKPKTRYGLFAGVTILAVTLSAIGYLALHGWHF